MSPVLEKRTQVDHEGWPIVERVVVTPPGWDSPALAELIADPQPLTPRIVRPDPLEGFVFPKRRRRNPLPKIGILLLLITAGVSMYYAVHKTGTPIASVRPGDCLAVPAGGDISGKRLTRFNKVDCGSPHNAEVFATKIFPTDAPFPGEDALTKVATASCDESVPKAIRTHPDAATWSIRSFAPVSLDTYHQGEPATLLCLVSFPHDIPLRG